MAKSARASSKKINKTRLRAQVFGPVERARIERLSGRLQALAGTDATTATTTTTAAATTATAVQDEDVNMDKAEDNQETEILPEDDGMDIDSTGVKKTHTAGKGRSEKRQMKRKARRSKLVFPAASKTKKTQDNGGRRHRRIKGI